MEYREVTRQEREAMQREGVFDISGNIPAHPGYTGIHRLEDGSYWFKGSRITDPVLIHAMDEINIRVVSRVDVDAKHGHALKPEVPTPVKGWLGRLIGRIVKGN